MKTCRLFFIGVLWFSFLKAFSQYDPNTPVLAHLYIDEQGDSLAFVPLYAHEVMADRVFISNKQKAKYDKLVRKVRKVYPYAKMAGKKLRDCNDTMLTMKDEGKRKKYMKSVENEIKAQFGRELENLTMSEGAILIRLIDRETGQTSYELVKELRGSLSAFFWQTLAKVFDQDLKSQYDPEKDDKLIEEIIFNIEAGAYDPVK